MYPYWSNHAAGRAKGGQGRRPQPPELDVFPARPVARAGRCVKTEFVSQNAFSNFF